MSTVLDLADRVLDHIAAQYAEDLAPAIPRVWRSEIEDLRSDLRGWLHHSCTALANWDAIHSEMAFSEVVENGFRLHGAIDLVEEQSGRLRVTDFKTGKAPAEGLAFTGGGKTLQPLLYALAAEAALKKPVVKGRLYYCTQRGNFQEIEIPFNEAARNTIVQLLAKIDGEVGRGFLPAAPETGSCRLCDYRPACGPHEELRTLRKTRAALTTLDEIRRMR
jgi:CRISPR/Cas system-associated exonuclease Cas4 (RecB family)